MELSSPELIGSLLALQGAARRARSRRSTSAAIQPSGGGRRRNCHCGHCRECQDNARWERIFAEKFADPTYYGRLVTRAESPLSSL